MSLEDPALALERDVVDVLVDQNLDRERERVAAPGRGTLRAQRGLDAATTATDILLLFDLHELVADLDQVDQLGLFELAGHRAQLAAATRTRAVGVVELELTWHDGQRWLWRRTKRRARTLLLLAVLRSALLLLLGTLDRVLGGLRLGLQHFEHLER